MCEQTESNYLDGDVVWVKLGSCWWPGEVVGPNKLPPDVLPSFRKPPIAVVKFFQETTYEYVKNTNLIYKYNCSRKNEFINKGLYMYRTMHGQMEKFPEDVIRAETAVGGDKEILTRDEFQEVKKTPKKAAYAGLFGESAKKTPASGKKGRGRGRPAAESPSESTPTRTPSKIYKEKSDYKVHILVQPAKEPATNSDKTPTPSTSRAGSEAAEEKDKQETPAKVEPRPSLSTPSATPGTFSCPNCSFTTTRLNVLVLHNKTHSVSYTPYTPPRKKPASKSPTKSATKATKTPKTPRPRKEKVEKPKKAAQGKKRTAEDKPAPEVKKPKTDQEIKSSLLADWDDDVEEESNDESAGLIASASPEVPAGSESPAVPTPAELPGGHSSREPSSPEKKSDDSSAEKPECSSDSKYEFREDEDWPIEADGGRKIPRVKNPSKRKEDTKSLSLDEDEVAKEVAELLNKTAVPELPSVPEPLKVEENFPEPSIVKSPDKKPDNASEPSKSETAPSEPKPTKAIFKTKTFFRSRHSRSQDAIGKYVAEQLNAERIDPMDIDINGSEAVSSPEARESPPVDHVKVARLAPKIQLKKMKAEAAQLREKEKFVDRLDTQEEPKLDTTKLELDNIDIPLPPTSSQDVIYPTQEIKPIKDIEKPLHKEVDSSESTNDVNKILDEKLKARDIVETITEHVDPKLPEQILSCPQKVSNDFIGSLIKGADVTPTPNVNLSPDNKTKKYTKYQKHGFITESLVPVETSPLKSNDFSCNKINYCSPKRLTPEPTDPTPHVILKVQSPMKSPVTSEVLQSPSKKMPTSNLQKTYEQMIEPYMTESTASAVDALLSVSREADRVPRIVGIGPPEDLFEDDNKDGSTIEQEIIENNDNCVYKAPEDKNAEEPVQEMNGVINEPVVEELVEESQPMDIEMTIPNSNNILTKEQLETTTENVPSKSDIQTENMPSESDLQIAETLLNLPSTAIQNKTSEVIIEESVPMCVDEQHFDEVVTESVIENDDKTYEMNETTTENEDVVSDLLVTNKKNIENRYESELEESENLNAAQSLVQMSESMDHKMNVVESNVTNDKDIPNVTFKANQNNGLDTITTTVEQKIEIKPKEIQTQPTNGKSSKPDITTSKLLMILEEPPAPKPPVIKTSPVKQATPTKKVVVTGKEKILNFDVANASLKSKAQVPKQKIIIRRTGSTKISSGGFLNNLSDVVASPDKIILSRSNVAAQDGSSVQTFTIQASPDITTASDAKQIIIQPKLRKVPKPPPTKIQKIKSHNSLVQWNEAKPTETPVTEEQMFDINSMPVVLSDDILTPESIEKMPIVMSDGNLITNTPPNPPKVVKTTTKTIIEPEKVHINPSPSKPEVKTLLMNTVSDVNKVSSTPNILSKSAKLRGAKPMLVIDKTTGKQKIIMTKAEPAVKEIKQQTTLLQPVTPTPTKTEKFIILPTGASPRGTRTQKIVIDPQTGKAHMLVTKGQETQVSAPENKPVSAKLIPSSADASSPGNTVMIITNAQGAQSRIVLTPEHEKILFPNKQQPNVSQLKTITHRITTSIASGAQKSIITPASPVKAPTKILPKQKNNAIITSKGQLIVGGRVTSTAQNIVPMPEIRPTIKQEMRTVPKRIVASEPKKLVQTIQKNASEPLIFLQQKSGAVMQLTAAQFEHLQRTGQIVQKAAPVPENKIVVQKSITISPKESPVPTIQKQQRVRKSATASPTPAKRVKQLSTIVAAAPSAAPVPPLTALSSTAPAAPPLPSMSAVVPTVSENISISTTRSGYPELDNFEELLPSTAISRPAPEVPAPAPEPQPEPSAPPPPEPTAEAPPAQLSDGQLLAVPGENFGGPPGTFYLCFEENGTFHAIDNRPLVLENNQLVPMAAESAPVFAAQPERRDILEAALANSDVFHGEGQVEPAPDFRDLNANVSVHCRVSETSSTLHQPIMTPVEVPTKADSEPAVPSDLEAGLAVIGVTPHTVPTSLELPITVTDPRIAMKTTDPLSNCNYGAALLASPSAELRFAGVVSESGAGAGAGVMSMPLLADEEAVGKSMPILTDEVAVSSVSSGGSRSPSLGAREADDEAGGGWGGARRLLTPATDCSDASETSQEIPLQPHIQLSVGDLAPHT